ncbi:MAG: sodium:solute symporter family protein [Verrucomicrobiota bacterium]
MTLFGLPAIDLTIIAIYFVTVLAIGYRLSRRNRTESDFFLAGRKLGKWYSFFLNFGGMTDPSQATATSASVYKQGIGGIWLLLIPMFITPYYWFMLIWFRRVRLTTMSDLFKERFGGNFLPTLYAITSILSTILSISFGNIVSFKTLQPIMVKQESAYTAQERVQVAQYAEFMLLRRQRDEAGSMSPGQIERYDGLKSLYDRGVLKPYVPHLTPMPFYIASSLLVCVFIVLGGLAATAIVDGLQAILLAVISTALIGIGLARAGWLAGLHAHVPSHLFDLFGGGGASEYTWYSIAALLLASFIANTGSGVNMVVGGSARDEFTARLGSVTGAFGKRILTIAWGFSGLIAVALFGLKIADPEETWGVLTRELLPVGLVGLMIVALLGGKLAYLASASLTISALTVKNLYEPLVKGRSERHYVFVARLTIPLLLGIGVLVAAYMQNILSLLKFMITFGVIWGVPVLLTFVWRRVTETAVRLQVIICLLLLGLAPYVISANSTMRRAEALTVTTEEKKVEIRISAGKADVDSGRAGHEGETITRTRINEPAAIFFEEGVARINPNDPKSPKEGLGRFSIEVYLVHLLGINVKALSPAMLMTTRFLVDALLPIILLVVLSLLTPRGDPQRIGSFYAKLKTPIAQTPELDLAAVAESQAHPARFDHTKLFPGTDLELTRWNRQDSIGFAACCGFVILLLAGFKGILLIGH